MIFIDPPTFSNSKKFKGTFDVQRDHVALINRAMNRLSAAGVLYFSNNYTRFELDDSLKNRYEVIDITHKTIGFDFDIKKPIHQSFEIRHKNAIKTAEIDVYDDMPNDRSHSYQTQNKADNKPFAKSSDKSSDSASSRAFDQSAKGERKSFDRSDKKHLSKKDFNQSKYQDGSSAKSQAKPQGKFQAKSQGKRFDRQTDIARASDKPTSDKPSIKRVYVNPKLADGERLAQSLTQKLTDKSNDAQTTSRYRIKRKDSSN